MQTRIAQLLSAAGGHNCYTEAIAETPAIRGKGSLRFNAHSTPQNIVTKWWFSFFNFQESMATFFFSICSLRSKRGLASPCQARNFPKVRVATESQSSKYNSSIRMTLKAYGNNPNT